MNQPTIGYWTIVKNERETLKRCLDTVAPYVSHITVVDTGSTDGTYEYARELVAKFGNGHVQQRPWQGFSHNLNEALTIARNECATDYLLHSGATELVQLRKPLPALTAPVYLVNTAGDLSYWRPILHQAHIGNWADYETHPYFELGSPGAHAVRLDALEIEDVGYNDDRPAKLARDKDALARRFLDDPTDPRTVFYLAQTLRCMGDEKAVPLYRYRCSLGGFDEEVYYSMLMDGCMTGNVHRLLEAFEYRPTRAEALRQLVNIYDQAGMTTVARMFVQAADQVPFPDEDMLFVHRDAYRNAPSVCGAPMPESSYPKLEVA